MYPIVWMERLPRRRRRIAIPTKSNEGCVLCVREGGREKKWKGGIVW